MPTYWILSHVKGDLPDCYARTEIEAVDNDDAVRKFNEFIENRESVQEQIGVERDCTTLVEVISRVSK